MKRVQLDFEDAYFEDIENLQKEAGFATRKDLFNNAISFIRVGDS